jgi:class III poly(R)-hydroxyalkanoic acid synthase PhaE subunit
MQMKDRDPVEGERPVMDNWVEAQKSIMDSWFNLAAIAMSAWQPSTAVQQGTEPQADTGDRSGAGPVLVNSAWQQLWEQHMQAATTGATPIIKASIEQFNAAQEYMLRTLQYTARAWKAFATEPDPDRDVQSEIERARDKALQEWQKWPVEFSITGEDVNKLWEQYLLTWQSYGLPWMSALQRIPEISAGLMRGESASLAGFAELFRDAYKDTLGQLVSSPNLGPGREFNEKLLGSFDAWINYQLAIQDYQAILLAIWREAIDDYFDRLLVMAENGEKIDNIRDLTLLWTRGAEAIFSEAFQGQDYVLAQGKMLNAAMDLRIRQRELMDVYLQSLDLPTRVEMDEAHRRIYELRKEIKTLKKELREMKD